MHAIGKGDRLPYEKVNQQIENLETFLPFRGQGRKDVEWGLISGYSVFLDVPHLGSLLSLRGQCVTFSSWQVESNV